MGKKLSSLLALMVFAVLGLAQPALAASADLPLASESPLAGIGFDDKPLYLPVQRNFQMAMLTAGSELGRSCGKMEAYGWRMSQSEQARVNTIFNATVDRLRGRGYVVEMQTPNSISHDITMFTADSPNKHLLTMWSAGEIGLVMVLCETSAPPATKTATGVPLWPSVQTFPQDVMQSNLEAPSRKAASKLAAEKFSPLGKWVGSYVCGQGFTGATLSITKMRDNNFQGDFHFYPTAKNPSVPDGRYAVYGQYDPASERILINPGAWIKRPTDYYNTIIVGSFDVMEPSLSAYFQGINGCTSFEARRDHNPAVALVKPHHTHVKKPKAKKPAAASAAPDAAKPADASAVVPVPASPASVGTTTVAPSLVVGAPTPAASSTPAPTPASAAPQPAPAPVPAGTAAPAGK